MAASSIRSVYLEDFQSHDKTKIELAPAGGLTVIVGPTDSGKTAIVRGLRLLMYNVPQGTDYIRVGRSTATVAVEMSDGTKVARERSKSVNRYRIARPGESAQVFEGFGNAVPLEIQEVTGVRVVSIGDTIDLALNLSEQLDGPFLGKTVSGPVKAKILGSLAGTEEVDKAQQAVQLDLHRATQDEKRIADEIEILDARIKDYDYLPALAEQIESLESILAAVKEAQTRLYSLEVAKTKIDTIHEQRTQMLNILARWGGLAAAVSHVEYAEAALTRMQALSGRKASLASIGAQRAEWSRRLARWAGLEEATTLHAKAERTWDRARVLSNLACALRVTLDAIEGAKAAVDRWANLDAAGSAAHKCSKALSRVQNLESLRIKLVSLKNETRETMRLCERWIRLPDAVHVTASVPGLLDRLATLAKYSDTLTRLRQSRVVAEADLDRHSKALADAQSLYIDTLIAMGTCPFCGSQVSPESLSLHLKEVA